MANRLAVNLNQRIWNGEVSQVATMRTSMLPLVDIVCSDRLLADKSVDTSFASIANILDFYGRDLATDSGHAPIIGETGAALNYSKLGPQPSMANGG
jgi:hypothetical protein